LEAALELAVSAWLTGSAGCALLSAGAGIPVSGAASVAAFLLTYRFLVELRTRTLPIGAFDLRPVETSEPDQPVDAGDMLLSLDMIVGQTELLLTRSQMLVPPFISHEELVLDDALLKLQPDSRVVQLFDPARMPTAGELKSRIDRHLNRGRGAAFDGPQHDDSQALYDALADLRRSLA